MTLAPMRRAGRSGFIHQAERLLLNERGDCGPESRAPALIARFIQRAPPDTRGDKSIDLTVKHRIGLRALIPGAQIFHELLTVKKV